MNGAQSLLEAAAAVKSTVCFANPGTTELDIVAAFGDGSGVRPVLCLQENVCTGAADGWARISGRTGLTLLHLGPGLMNGLAGLHNARRAGTGIVNIVGDHPSWHVPFDPPLASDLDALAAAGTTHVTRSSSSDDVAAGFLRAWSAASAGPVVLVVPADHAAGPALPAGIQAGESGACVTAHAGACEIAVRKLSKATRPAILLGGNATCGPSLAAAAELARTTGARVLIETFPRLLDRGGGYPNFPRLPYEPERAAALLGEHDLLLLVGAPDPVAFFGNQRGHSRLCPPSTEVVTVARTSQGANAVAVLADLLPNRSLTLRERESPAVTGYAAPTGALTAAKLACVLAAHQPENAIVVDESNTSGATYQAVSAHARAHTQMGSTAGVLGFGLAASIGAAIAAPQRRVIALQADGAAAYTMQSLWTHANQSLDITTILLSNGGYETVRSEWARRGHPVPEQMIAALTSISEPKLDWVSIANGFGVPAARAENCEELSAALKSSFAEPGPQLIVAQL